ncbi:hypothetical protein tb265_49760 [Gemmatimonadetes bacterium T265]|nr:hypothetical protein tb265_49760 [Gemmatimonadetes bacterium T265]
MTTVHAGVRPPLRHALPPDALDAVWRLLGRQRRGTRYQPALAAASDPNGCVPKLALLRASGYRFAGVRVLSVGCSTGYYERHLVADGLRDDDAGSPGATSVDLIDTDAVALDEAARAVRAAGAARVRARCAPAERCPLDARYDVALFLSLYHHYDRLGGHGRAAGRRLLGRVGRASRTLFFETGQSDDRVRGADMWKDRLEMARHASPTAWLETEVPAVTGFDAFHRLGVNPRTNRALYVYWRERARPAGVFATGAADEATGVLRVHVRVEDGRAVAAPAGGAPGALGAALAMAASRPVLWDCAFTRPDVPGRVRAHAMRELLGAVAGRPPRSNVFLVHDPRTLGIVPGAFPAAVRIDGPDDATRARALAAARFAGVRTVHVAAAHTPTLARAAAALGAEVVTLAALPASPPHA